jgi:hypothetical protein
MYVIDGQVFGFGEWAELRPEDVVDVRVAEGAAAAAAYGPVKADVVVTITTRRAPPPRPAVGDAPRRMLVLVDGSPASPAALRAIRADRIVDIQLLRGGPALVRYFGEGAADGVVVVRTDRGDEGR